MEAVTESIVHEKKLEYLVFSVVDYILFGGMLVLSILIGVYFAFYKNQNTPDEYLLGGKQMKFFPVAVSLAASYVSAITLLGMPAEVYTYGGQYVMSCIGMLGMAFVIGKVYLPVFYTLQLTSSFEYLELRFGKKVRMVASFICLVGYIINIPVVMYVPALAFNLVSGIDMKYVTPAVCLICIFYTTIGGLRAVVWTDTIQFVMMNGSIFTILILGTINEGGLSKIWTLAEESGRTQFFDMDPSIYKRSTLLSSTVGMCLGWISVMGVNQMCIQRFLSVPSLADANKVLYIYCFAITLIKALCLFAGYIMYARYSGCDPLTSGVINKVDQILPYYVLDTARGIPGLPGLFIAGVFSAALSTMSSLLHTACGIVYKDFISMWMPGDTSDRFASTIMKSLVVILGLICMVMVYWVDRLGNILQLSISFDGIISGSLLGVFSMGMLIPRANSKGTVIGALISSIIMIWIFYGSNQAEANGILVHPKKPLSIDECNFSGNDTRQMETMTSKHPEEGSDDLLFIYRISVMWYSTIGIIITLLIGIPISYLTEAPSEKHMRPEYFSPVIHRFLPRHIMDKMRVGKVGENSKYKPVEIMMQDLKEDDAK